jgi:chromosome segregation ATPase
MSKLVRTPVKNGGTTGKHEFTPIGKRSRSVNNGEVLVESVEPHEKRPLFPLIPEDSHMLLPSDADSTFDNTTDVGMVPDRPPLSTTGNHSRQQGDQEQHFLHYKQPQFVNGFSSIKEQEDKLKTLDSENYMLRLKVLTLQRILNETPQEKKKMFADTINLQQQLVQAQQQIAQLQESQSNKENSADIDRYVHELKLKDQEILEYKHRLKNVDQLQSSEYAQLIQKLHEKDRELHNRDQEVLEYKSKLNEISRTDDRLVDELRSRDQQIHDLNGQLRQLSSNDRENDNLHHELQSKDNYIRSMESKINDLEQSLHQKDQAIHELNQRVATLAIKDGEIESSASSLKLKNQQIEDLQLKLSQHHELRLQNQQTLQELENLKQEFSQLKVENDRLSRTNLELSHATRSREDDTFLIQKKLRQAEDQVKQLEREIQDLNKTNGDVSFWKSKYDAIENEFQSLDSHQRDYKLEISNLKSEISHLTNKLNVANREINKKDQTLKSQEEHVTDNEALNKTLRKKIESLQFELQQSHNEESDLRTQINELIRLKSSLHSQDVIDRYVEEGTALKLQISKLKSELEFTKLQLSNQNDNNDNFSELTDRLRFYEAEYEEMKNKLDESLMKGRTLEQEISLQQIQISTLENENKTLHSKARTTDFDKSTFLLENNDRLQKTNQKLEEENRSLKGKLDSVNIDVERLRRSVSENQQHNNSYLSSEVDRLLNENLQLKRLIEQKNSYSRDYQLNDGSQTKDYVIKSLEEKLASLEFERDKLVRETNASKRSNNSTDEIRIRKLELEIDDLRREKGMEHNDLNAKLRDLELSQRRKSETRDGSAIQSLLELQLQEAIRAKDNVDKQLTDHRTRNSELQQKISLLEAEKREMERDNSESRTKLESTNDEKNKLQAKVQELNDAIKTISERSTSMNSVIEKLQQEKALHDKFENLNIKNTDELSKIMLEKLQLQKELETLKKPKPSTKDSLMTKQLQNELIYYKARMKDIMYNSNDLQVMHSFIMGCIKNSNRVLHCEIDNFVKCGIYPDYTATTIKPKVSFKVVAKFVLAGIRIKNRYKKAEKRRQQLLELRTQIEIGKIKIKQN